MKIFNSIRWRLQMWYGLILVVVLAGFGFTAFQMERGRLFNRIDDEFHRRVNELGNFLRRPPPGRGPRGSFDGPPPERRDDPENIPDQDREHPLQALKDFRLPPRIANQFDETDTNGFYYIIWGTDGHRLGSSTNAPERPSLPGSAIARLQGQSRNIVNLPGQPPIPPEPSPPQMLGNFRETTFSTQSGEFITVGRFIGRELHDLQFAALELVGIGSGILLFGLVGGWWMAGRAIRPIQDISSAAVKISAGDLSQRIDTAETESELGKLAAVLNSTFARLETSFAQQQQFTSDAAHELRTPVSVMLTQTQTALNRDRTAPEYRETLAACQRSAQRMRRLIESLLELARLDAGQEQLKRLTFDCAATVHECTEAVSPLAEERGVRIISELEPLNCVGDPERISQVITNLLTNAIQYNRIGGQVRVSLKSEKGLGTLIVSDSGVGIPAADLPHVFERFYRGDKARSGSNGHSGLGLAICKAIIEAHGGTIEVTSEPERGTTFTVRLPTTA